MKRNKASSENFYQYNIHLKYRARKLRKKMTKAEKKLWQMLRKKSICKYSFLRQRSVLYYVADFMLKELLLIIEVDGLIHEEPKQKKRDQKREADLIEAGFTILRFKNWEVIYSPDSVYLEIKNWIDEKMTMLGNEQIPGE